MIDYTIPDKETPADEYVNNPQSTDLLASFQMTNNRLQQMTYSPFFSSMQSEQTGGQKLSKEN